MCRVYKTKDCTYCGPKKTLEDHGGYYDLEYKLINKGKTVVEIASCWHCFRVLKRTYFDKRKTDKNLRR